MSKCYVVVYLLTYVLPVRRPASHTDVGLCLIRYASSIAGMWSERAFTSESFDKDGHRSLISSHKNFSIKRADITNLREECLRLVCRISQKYCTVRKHQSNTSAITRQAENGYLCCTPTNFIPGDVIHDEDSCTSTFSSDVDSTFSSGSGSLYAPEEDDNIHDESDRFCNDNMNRFVDSDNDIDDEQSVEEYYTDFTTHQCTAPSLQESIPDNDPDLVDNLICPGDLVEYRELEEGSTVKKASIISIESCTNARYIVLASGALLHSKKHAVRKVEMYCSATRDRVPNPLAQWFCLDKCLLQQGTVQTKRDEENTIDKDFLVEEIQK